MGKSKRSRGQRSFLALDIALKTCLDISFLNMVQMSAFRCSKDLITLNRLFHELTQFKCVLIVFECVPFSLLTLETAGRRWGERTERDSYQGCDKALSTAQWIIADPRTHAGGAGPQHHTRPAARRGARESCRKWTMKSHRKGMGEL